MSTIDQPNVSGDVPSGDFFTGLGADTWSGSWRGIIQMPATATYWWRGTANDGQRLYVDARPVFEEWRQQDAPRSIQMSTRIDAGWHAFKYEFYH